MAKRALAYATTLLAICTHDNVSALIGLYGDDRNVDETDDEHDEWRPIHYAVHAGAINCLKWLIQRGANVKVIIPSSNRTLIDLAMHEKVFNMEILAALLEAGGDPQAGLQYGWKMLNLPQAVIECFFRHGMRLKYMTKPGWIFDEQRALERKFCARLFARCRQNAAAIVATAKRSPLLCRDIGVMIARLVWDTRDEYGHWGGGCEDVMIK